MEELVGEGVGRVGGPAWLVGRPAALVCDGPALQSAQVQIDPELREFSSGLTYLRAELSHDLSSFGQLWRR